MSDHQGKVGSIYRLVAAGGISIAIMLAWGLAGAGAQEPFNEYQLAVLADEPSLFVTFDGNADDISGSDIETRLNPDSVTLSDRTALGSGNSLVGFRNRSVFSVPKSEEAEEAIFTTETTIEFMFAGDVASFGGSGLVGTSAMDASVEFNAMFVSVNDNGEGFPNFFVEPLEDDRWYHLALVHAEDSVDGDPVDGEPSGEFRLYLDGVLIETVATAGGLDHSRSLFSDSVLEMLEVATDYLGSPLFADELAVYPRALSGEEIREHADLSGAGAPLNFPDPLPFPDTDLSFRFYTAGNTDFLFCTVQVETDTGWCFSTEEDRQSYIDDDLIGTRGVGTVWLGLSTEEVVAP